MKASFLPTTTYGVQAVYQTGWPSPPSLFEPELGRRMMEEMFEQASLADELGFDWISFSEHHYAPLLVPTPNPALFAAAALHRIQRAKIALFGPILPLRNPIHVAEEIAMLDVLSGGRLLLLFLRGVPYELRAFSINLDESRAMTQEATRLIIRALTDPQPFSWEGTYYHYQTVSVWPGLMQRPHPPLYSTGNSFESASFAASEGHGLALSFAPLSYVAQVVLHYKAEAAKHGWEPRADQILFRGNLIATDTDEEAQQLADQLATLPHLKRPSSAPAPAAPPKEGEQHNVGPVAPVLIGTAQFCGGPQTLVAQMRALYSLGVGVVDLVVPTGLMSQAKVLHSLELFAREVLPDIHSFSEN
ncbi:MAG TPA: LLM class flavin-dependent oxidoreductase [Ktedonobacterales bacterium]|jgi:alkanesulfonate monooxygenase SsuD/methylene tetrahydromethanopterin reductase-like flavin-dependent oxidoreductase (luciferase family)